MFINVASFFAIGVDEVTVAGKVAIEAVVAVGTMAAATMKVTLRTNPVRSLPLTLTLLTWSSTVDPTPHSLHKPQFQTLCLNGAAVVAVVSVRVAIDSHPQRLRPVPRR
jgi:hypothetical protein